MIKVPSYITDKVVGLSVQEAADLLKTTVRPVKIDGKHLGVTMDYRPTRLNVVVVDGKITETEYYG